MSLLHTDSLPRRTVTTSFGEIAYAEAGSGPVALFVHGVFLHADVWKHQLGELGDLRRCVAVDLLAHGASDEGSGALTMSEQADMVLAFMDALGIEGADLVGNDTGGAIVQLICARAPGRVTTATLTNCDTDDNLPPKGFLPIQDMAKAGLLADGLAALANDPGAARRGLASGLEDPDSLDDATATGFFAPFATRSRAMAVQAYVAGMEPSVTVAVRDGLAKFEAPTLIVWGTGDEFFDVSWARWLESTIPGTVGVVELPGAKLFFPLERPRDFNRELRLFWTR
jgi:pimeloyl-ACP methyl ester carboxylesterase